MHLGPEWMRTKPQTPARPPPPPPPSPPPPPAAAPAHQLGTSTYSALVAPVAHDPDSRDDSRPFRYPRDEMLRIYRDGGGKGGLNLEVERWEGIVRDVATEPAGLREMSDVEKKLFAGPLNSELRRRQSTDLANTLSSSSDRQRVSNPNSTANNAIRYGPFLARRRDSTDQPPLSLPRKLSLSSTPGGALTSPRDALPSPRNRMGTFGSGFDGVLNTGDSWSRKRPLASASLTTGSALGRGEAKEEDSVPSEIKEEEEGLGHDTNIPHDSDPGPVTDRSSSRPRPSSSNMTPDRQVFPASFDSVSHIMEDMSLDARSQSNSDPPLQSGPRSGLTDPASVEWSYLDPQGQVQGPFRADVMQKWFDEGYFTPDLLMKRTHVDIDWIAVGILERRAAGRSIFLSQIPNGPPGLVRHADSPESYSPVHEQNLFNGYHTVPTRTLRTTLDSYPNGSPPAESPSSSFDVGRFSDGSPDLSTFGGITGNGVYSSDPNFTGRTFGGRAAFQDSIQDPRAVDNNSSGRVPHIDTFNVYSGGGDGSPWSAGPGQPSQGFNDNGFNGIGSGMIGSSLPVSRVHNINQEHYSDTMYSAMGILGRHHDSPVARQPSDVNGLSFNSNMVDGLGPQFGAPMQFSQPSSVSYTTPHNLQTSPFGDILPQNSDVPNVAQTPTSVVQPNSASLWTTCTKPFEPPTASSPVVPPQASEWTTPQAVQPVDPSPWLMASLPVVDDVWREIPGPNSLTFSNLGRHNKLQQRDDEGVDVISDSPTDDTVPFSSNTRQEQTEAMNVVSSSSAASQSVPPTTPTRGTQGPITQKARRKSMARDAQVPACKVVLPSTPTAVRDMPAPSVPALSATLPKHVWAVEDDSKKLKGTGVTMSLREIQEAEVKKAEARKAAEKERERLARTNAVTNGNSVDNEIQSFTSSWGLPISQAGARNLIPPKENSSISPTPGAPVWTNATPAPAAKKTMKEIQEEEERRKKLGVKESVASATARRAYAETTVKVVPSAQATGGSWTTVGPNGKPTPPATNTPRPAANTSQNNPAPTTTTPRSNGAATRQAAALTVKAATPRVEDFPITPSHDFLKWLGESLKGLNSSVNLEEITSMLLSFPIDPDQSTIEIISDLIYANSTTLDGRRFASEYVSKRKVDAATRRGTAGALGASSKPVSIADVVKTQPKPVQQEWGFKVVNKKKKGARS